MRFVSLEFRLSVPDFVSQLPKWKPGFEAKDLYMSLMLLVLLDRICTRDWRDGVVVVRCMVPLSFIQMAHTMARLVIEMVENPPHVRME